MDEPFDWPIFAKFGRTRVPLLPGFSFLTTESGDFLGTTTCILFNYQYTEDLTFILYWDHLFADDGVRDGSYTLSYGHAFSGGADNGDADYAFFWTIIKF